MMPALKYITEDQAGLLWKWLRAVGTKPVPAYRP